MRVIRFIAAAVVVGFVAFNPLTLSVVGGMIATNDLQARAVQEVRDANFMTSCALYKDASTWERWITPMHWTDSWCADYIGRM